MLPDEPLVSVVIPMRNEARHIKRCLESLLEQDYPEGRLEILAVDGGSTDGSSAIVEEISSVHPNVRLLHNPKGITPAGFNVGIREARGEVIAIVSAHAYPEKDYVQQCIAAFQRSGADGVGGLMRPVSNTYIGRAIAMAMTSRFGVGDARFHYSNKEQFVDTIYMAVYRREVFDKIGLFDEELVRNQDYELNYRLRRAGGRVLLSPAIKSYYVPRSSLPALWRQYFSYGLWKVRMLLKHPRSLRWRQAVPPLFVSAFFGSLLLGLFWPPARWLFAAIAGCYLLANLTASIIAASRGGWRYLPILPIVFATIHSAWGLGFLWSVVSIAGLRRPRR
jgi:succinoglycan biosynthesis protein ExoA